MTDYRRGSYPQRGGYGADPATAPRIVTAQKIPDNFVDSAEQIINALQGKVITNTKIRKLFGLFTDLYNEVKLSDEQILTPAQKQALATARIRLVYECGRVGSDSDVSQFVQQAKLLEYLKGIGESRETFLKFHQYFEALVAYHRYRFGDK